MLQAQIFIDKDEQHENSHLQDFIMQLLLKHKMAGATVFRGQIGFGPNQHLKRPGEWFSFDEPPLLITFIDEDAKVKKVLTALREKVKGGLIITHAVEKW